MNSIARPSIIFEIGDIVRVPFPYVERDRAAVRPALIFSRPIGLDKPLVWTLMITSARRGVWPGDVAIGPDHAKYGLPVPCYVRTAKIAVLEVAAVDSVLGRLPADIMQNVSETVAEYLA